MTLATSLHLDSKINYSKAPMERERASALFFCGFYRKERPVFAIEDAYIFHTKRKSERIFRLWKRKKGMGG